ncbi:MAG: hypothetical protein V4677_12410 [Bacteroidota bacterium]
MKKITIILTIATSFAITSCEKEYTCVCTNKTTGERSPGDKVKTTKLGKKGFEESCKANDDVFENDLKDCHVE